MPALRPRLGAFAVLTLVFVAACGTTTPSAAPSSPPSDPPSAEPSGAAAGDATWWVDTTLIPLAPETTEIKGFVIETACASGQSPEGRVNEPVIEYGAESVTVTFTIVPPPGDAQDCPSNPEFPVTVTLTEPLGERALLDGGSNPPRDATTTP
jgi:hypothetical protein